jgi:hypothetical protein
MTTLSTSKSSFKRVARVTAGLALLPVGVAMLVLPGPGSLLILSSLMLLAEEFNWAGRALATLNQLTLRSRHWLLSLRPLKRRSA